MANPKIKDFFNGRFFEIPKYQRGYAWELQNIRDLFTDIVESIDSNSNHYIGTFVLSKASKEDTYYIVDGQQRITTITLIINELIRNLSSVDASYYKRFYIQEDSRYRLIPLSRDKAFFLDALEGTIGTPINKSQRHLKAAIEEIQTRVKGIKDKSIFLKSLEKLEVMQFIEESEGDAIRIFQTVNDRGKPLSNMEKAKSLLIYFSNRYLDKKLDDKINETFSNIFEIYDDIKHIGEEISINLIKNRDFDEDSLMRYHFVTFSDETYDPTAKFVLQKLKSELTEFRSSNNYSAMNKYITNYISSLETFFQSLKEVIERAKVYPRYYKIFSILNLSATLYPLIIKLHQLNLLDKSLPNRSDFDFLYFVELLDVRVYKTRGTDPKADIAYFVYNLDKVGSSEKEIEGWLSWFNSRWMPKETFASNLHSYVFGNRALNHIFINYSEHLRGKQFTIEELKEITSKNPNIEHILAQAPKFSAEALGFLSKEDFSAYEHTIGNLTLLEKSLNSMALNKMPFDKIDIYSRSLLKITRNLSTEISEKSKFTKVELETRTKELVSYCIKNWWC